MPTNKTDTLRSEIDELKKNIIFQSERFIITKERWERQMLDCEMVNRACLARIKELEKERAEFLSGRRGEK